MLKETKIFFVINLLLVLFTLSFVYKFESQFIWSPYYKIRINPFDTIVDSKTKEHIRFKDPVGYSITVNNDFHQQILDLKKSPNQHEFQKSWSRLYDWPHQEDGNETEGPILIVGAGSGNDVSAALRNTTREIHAVEIDPKIIEFGKQFHPENPYGNKRVKIINTDARSYFNKTDVKYARVVFGFLDSHTLMSNFSSLRLDNFVYTLESLQQVREILKPNGTVYLTFDSNTQWIHDRLSSILENSFGQKPEIYYQPDETYADGVVYKNIKNIDVGPLTVEDKTNLSTDNWPFLYLKKPNIPSHYAWFILFVLILSFLSLTILPKNERSLTFHYFFLGAGFFLIETSNIVKLSLLYGSTWFVNVMIFSGVLFLVLIGTLIRTKYKKIPLVLIWTGLFAGCLFSYFVPPGLLLNLNFLTQSLLMVVIYLGPILFASLLFAHFIDNEKNLYKAYGSNLLGAMVGGVCEYLSLLYGFSFLSILAASFYFLALSFVLLKKHK